MGRRGSLRDLQQRDGGNFNHDPEPRAARRPDPDGRYGGGGTDKPATVTLPEFGIHTVPFRPWESMKEIKQRLKASASPTSW